MNMKRLALGARYVPRDAALSSVAATPIAVTSAPEAAVEAVEAVTTDVVESTEVKGPRRKRSRGASRHGGKQKQSRRRRKTL